VTSHSTLLECLLATPFIQELLPVFEILLPTLRQLAAVLVAVRRGALTPQATWQLENDLQALLREVGRSLLQWLFQQAEPADPAQNPGRLFWEGEVYRRRNRHPHQIASVFGSLAPRRFLYEPLERGGRSIHPLELRLGVEAGCATAALADRVGQWAAQLPQRGVQAMLRRDHGVVWSCVTLRKVTARLAAGLAEQRQETQADKLLRLLEQAFRSRGKLRPVLAVGRDGIHVPMRESPGQEYHEGAVGTLSVYDRRGKRLGTVYLGRMPEAKQAMLSAQWTALLTEASGRWQGDRPRLAYVTDAGWHPTEYFEQVLRRLEDPRRPGQRLLWERILDFYHACTYVTRLAETLFEDGRTAQGWGRRMRRLLKERHGLTRLLQSASYHRNQRRLPAAQAQAYENAYRYLRKRGRLMDYHRYRRQGLPLGSGVTEAACKTVFTQRLKQSGLGWKTAGGQAIVDLRVIWLSGVWQQATQAYRMAKPLPKEDTIHASPPKKPEKAA
jgi:hypothetical protein